MGDKPAKEVGAHQHAQHVDGRVNGPLPFAAERIHSVVLCCHSPSTDELVFLDDAGGDNALVEHQLVPGALGAILSGIRGK